MGESFGDVLGRFTDSTKLPKPLSKDVGRYVRALGVYGAPFSRPRHLEA